MIKRLLAKQWATALVGLLTFSLPSVAAADQPTTGVTDEILLVLGAPGTEEFGEQFGSWASAWRSIAQSAGASIESIGDDDHRDATDRDRLQEFVQSAAEQSESTLWIILIGHGTFTRGVAKFNLRGPDVSAAELADWLAAVRRPMVIVNAASSSGPFINQLSAPGRVVVTATKSGTEQNFARFGEYFVRAVAAADADLDHDGEVSVLEAFLRASADVGDFYQSAARIATEHPLIDDNGDGKGTPPTMFRAARAVGKAKDGSQLDGVLAKRFTLAPAEARLKLTPQEEVERDSIEQELATIRGRQNELEEEAYDQQIEPLLIRLAKIYQAAEQRAAELERVQ